jgi:hypothetical protein
MKQTALYVMIISGLVTEGTGDTLERMLVQIRAPRQSISTQKLTAMQDPFIKISRDTNRSFKVKPVQKKTFRLDGIFNQKAYINGAWRKEGDLVSGFVLEHIGDEKVILKHGQQSRYLFLHQRKKSAIRIEGGVQ